MVAAFFLVSCLGDGTGPGEFGRGSFAFTPVFLNQHAQRLVDFARVRIRLVRPGETAAALDTVVDFPSTADSIEVRLSVPLQGGSSEQFDLTLAMINAAGDTVFRGGPTRVTASVGTPTTAPTVPIVYVGVGANAAGVRFVTVPAMAFFQDTVSVVAEAYDNLGAVIAGTPIVYTSLDGNRLSVPVEDVGRIVAGTVRGLARLEASLLTTATRDTAAVLVQPKPASIAIISGNNQSGIIGTALAQAVVIEVRGADNLGVSGVTVNFAVTAGGGTLSASSAVTDSDEWKTDATSGSSTTATVRSRKRGAKRFGRALR